MAKKSAASWKRNLTDKRYGEHKHCMVCGNAVPLTQDFCSQPCKDSYNKIEKDKGKKNTWQIVMIFGFMIVMMVILPMLTG